MGFWINSFRTNGIILHLFINKNMLILYKKYKIDPTYLLTGEKNHTFDVEMFLANCSREERDKFLDRMLIYMRKLMISPQ